MIYLNIWFTRSIGDLVQRIQANPNVLQSLSNEELPNENLLDKHNLEMKLFETTLNGLIETIEANPPFPGSVRLTENGYAQYERYTRDEALFLTKATLNQPKIWLLSKDKDLCRILLDFTKGKENFLY